MLSCYGTPYWGENESFWQDLEGVAAEWEEPWLLLGDFNEVLNVGGKFGGRLSYSRRFFLNGFVQQVGAFDLGYVGKHFT